MEFVSDGRNFFDEQKPFIAGEKVTAVDLALAPKLYHMKIALPHYKKWSVPAELTNLISYLEVCSQLHLHFSLTSDSASYRCIK